MVIGGRRRRYGWMSVTSIRQCSEVYEGELGGTRSFARDWQAEFSGLPPSLEKSEGWGTHF
jgi:hypothetical protein